MPPRLGGAGGIVKINPSATNEGKSTTLAQTDYQSALTENVTLVTSKGVVAAVDITLGSGLVGVAAGHPSGKGLVYPNGTSTNPDNLKVQTKSGMDVTTNLSSYATAAAS